MCVSLKKTWSKAEPWKVYEVPCGHCWSCLKNRLDNYVGKALAEASVSDWSCAVTLTYAPRDDGADKLIEKKHLQNFFKAVRRQGHKIRYLAAGEYGSRGTERAHFHVILFGKGGMPPQIPDKQNVHWMEFHQGIPSWISNYSRHDLLEHGALWPHGHVYLDKEFSAEAFRYVAKYCLKKHGNEWITQSKVPVLGFDYFIALADEYAQSDVLPASLNYRPPGSDIRDRYSMRGAAEREFLMRLFSQAPHLKNRPCTEWLEGSIRRLDKYVVEREWKKMSARERRYYEEYHMKPTVRWKNTLDNHVRLRLDTMSDHKRLFKERKWLDDLRAALGRDDLDSLTVERSVNRVLMQRARALAAMEAEE